MPVPLVEDGIATQDIKMNKFVAAIKAQEAYQKKPKPPRERVVIDRRPPVKESQIMQVLSLQQMGMSPTQIAKHLDLPVQTIYNVRQRYSLIQLENGEKWYKYLGAL